MVGATMTTICRRSPKKVLRTIEVRGIVKVSKGNESDPFTERYWTETLDVSAKSKDGKQLFNAFHIIAVPEGQLESFERLRRQMRESLVSELQESIQRLQWNGYSWKRIV
jgi:hypothetical protein